VDEVRNTINWDTRRSKGRSAKGYLTTTELGELCGVSRSTILNWIEQGKVKAFRTMGGHHRIPASEAAPFIESAQAGGAEEAAKQGTEEGSELIYRLSYTVARGLHRVGGPIAALKEMIARRLPGVAGEGEGSAAE